MTSDKSVFSLQSSVQIKSPYETRYFGYLLVYHLLVELLLDSVGSLSGHYKD